MPIQRRIRSIKQGMSSPEWWRDRVFVPYVIGTLTRLHPAYPGYDEAINVMEQDWDNLVILDACRADVFEAEVDTRQFDDYSRIVSLGSHSSEWTRRTFNGRTFDDTVYISMNPHTSLLADDTFHEVVELWRDYEGSPNTIDPHAVVEKAIESHHQFPNKRLVIHFMQPHGTGGLVDDEKDREDAYRETTAKVIDFVVELHDQLDGKTVITADHGELFNSGFAAKLGIDSHKSHLRLPELVSVPWAVIDGSRRSITTGTVSGSDTSPAEIKERLRDLGYH